MNILRVTDARMISVLPLDRDLFIALDSLPASFHGDPADRVIVATARTHTTGDSRWRYPALSFSDALEAVGMNLDE